MDPSDRPAPVQSPSPQRRLSAVWFADIVGYTALAARDESAAIQVAQALHAVALQHVGQHGGRVVKVMGDAVLAEFATTEAAVLAALSLMEGFVDAPLRIGVHTGEIVSTPDGDVFGDGVNTAARLQREAEPGQVIVSEDVWRQLRTRPAVFAFQRIGTRTPKGIAYPLVIYRALRAAAAPSPTDEPKRPAWVPAWLGAVSGRVPRLAGRDRGRRAFSVPQKTAALTIFLVLGGGSLLAWQMRTSTVAAFPNRGWALLANFENETPIDGLDGALSTALAIALEQSAHVNIAAGPRIENALQRMRRDGDAPLDPATAREVAIREGLDIILLPTVTGVGEQFVIALRIEEPTRGANLKTISVRARGEDEILDALDELAVKLRRYLGESGGSIARRRQPLEEATTASLPALQQYSLGFAAQRRGRYREAKLYYSNAIKLDSTFVRALASLGMLEWEKGREFQAGAAEFEGFDPERGKQLLRRAVSHLDGATDRERLAIQATHAFAVEGDIQQAIEHYQLRLAQYPDDYVSYNNLGRFYYYQGRHEESVAAYKQVLHIYPGLSGAYDGVVATYLYLLGEVDSARVWARRQIAVDSTHFRAFDFLGWAYVGSDSLERAAQAFARAVELNPDYTLARFRLGHTHRMLGNHSQAISSFQEILKRDPGDLEAVYDLGVTFGSQGNRQLMSRYLADWRSALSAELTSKPTPERYFAVATASVRLGDTSRAEEEERRGLALLGDSSQADAARSGQRRWLGVDSVGYFELAALRTVQGRHDEAMVALESAAEHGLTNYILLLQHPDFEGLRSHPRFNRMIDGALHRKNHLQ